MAKALLFLSLLTSSSLAFTPKPTSTALPVSAALDQETTACTTTPTPTTLSLQQAKATVITRLQQGLDDENSPSLQPFLDTLYQSYESSGIDARFSEYPCYNGDWANINMPAFPTRLGFNADGLPLYKVARNGFSFPN